jgi:hypothetical protein
MIYTAVTRAVKTVVLVEDRRRLEMPFACHRRRSTAPPGFACDTCWTSNNWVLRAVQTEFVGPGVLHTSAKR